MPRVFLPSVLATAPNVVHYIRKGTHATNMSRSTSAWGTHLACVLLTMISYADDAACYTVPQKN